MTMKLVILLSMIPMDVKKSNRSHCNRENVIPYRKIMDTIPRIVRIEADDPYSAGVRLGESLGRSFGAYLENYLAARILSAKNCAKLSETHAVAWINALPQHICDRFRGLSGGSGIPFERIAYWGYQEMALSSHWADNQRQVVGTGLILRGPGTKTFQ